MNRTATSLSRLDQGVKCFLVHRPYSPYVLLFALRDSTTDCLTAVSPPTRSQFVAKILLVKMSGQLSRTRIIFMSVSVASGINTHYIEFCTFGCLNGLLFFS